MDAAASKRCSACGYCLDALRAEGERVRCPECGIEQVPRLKKPFPGVMKALWDGIKPALIACAAALGVTTLVTGAQFISPKGEGLYAISITVIVCALLLGIVAPVVSYGEISGECDLSEAPSGWGIAVVLGGWAANATVFIGHALLTVLGGAALF